MIAFVGTVKSASWGYRIGKNLAMGFVDAGCAGIGTKLAVNITGGAFPAVICEECLYDPTNERGKA